MSNRAVPPQPNFAAYVGIDWGDKKHAWALQAEGSSNIEEGQVLHTPEAIQEWAAGLQRRFPTGCVAIALEQSRGPLVFALSKYEHLVLYPIHPTSAADYRKIFRPSGAKSDGEDAAMHLDMLIRHRDRLRPLNPDTRETRALQLLTEDRRQLVNERTRYSNRLGADLKSYFPSYCIGLRILMLRLYWICWSGGQLWRNCSELNLRPCASFSGRTGVGTKPKMKSAWKPSVRAWRRPPTLRCSLPVAWPRVPRCASSASWANRFGNTIDKLKNWPRTIPILRSSIHCPAPDRCWSPV